MSFERILDCVSLETQFMIQTVLYNVKFIVILGLVFLFGVFLCSFLTCLGICRVTGKPALYTYFKEKPFKTHIGCNDIMVGIACVLAYFVVDNMFLYFIMITIWVGFLLLMVIEATPKHKS